MFIEGATNRIFLDSLGHPLEGVVKLCDHEPSILGAIFRAGVSPVEAHNDDVNSLLVAYLDAPFTVTNRKSSECWGIKANLGIKNKNRKLEYSSAQGHQAKRGPAGQADATSTW
jgi:hypothetical protein